MVVRPNALFDLVHRLLPPLSQAFLNIQRAIGTGREQAVVDEVYRTLAPVNFSKGLMERVPLYDLLQVSVIPARGVYWNDWGSEQRLLADWKRAGSTSRAGGNGRPQPSLMESRGRRMTWAETA